ncbi:hypothetical protein [Terrarubrum flagellatum]|uniref:hypothetical protein n=1 Tax=Terrirubrum flagellatum TaxID=2895980 RepID=UPI0031456745
MRGWLSLPIAALMVLSGSSAMAQQPAPTGAFTGPITIKNVKVQLFLEKTAHFSENIADSEKPFENVVRGESVSEPASGVLVTLEVAGPKNGQSNDKIARHMAQVNITRKYRAGPKLEQRVFGGFRFNEQGVAYKAFMVDAATCAPLEIEARLGASKKTVKVEFSCTAENT